MTPSSWNSSRARKTVARPMPGRSAWRRRRGPRPRSGPSADRRARRPRGAARSGGVRMRRGCGGSVQSSCADDTESHVAASSDWPDRAKTGPGLAREGRRRAAPSRPARPADPDRLPVRGAIATVSVPPQSSMPEDLPWTAARLPPPRRAARSAVPAALPSGTPIGSGPGARPPAALAGPDGAHHRRRSGRRARAGDPARRPTGIEFGPAIGLGQSVRPHQARCHVPGEPRQWAIDRQGRCAGDARGVGRLPVSVLRSVRPHRGAGDRNEPRDEGDRAHRGPRLLVPGARLDPDESMAAAIAARCADRQGKFWDYYEMLFGTRARPRTAAHSRSRASSPWPTSSGWTRRPSCRVSPTRRWSRRSRPRRTRGGRLASPRHPRRSSTGPRSSGEGLRDDGVAHRGRGGQGLA